MKQILYFSMLMGLALHTTNAATAEEKLSNSNEGSENKSSAPKSAFGNSTYWQNIKK